MRLTTDQILEKYPSMWISGKQKDYDLVQARYYGDIGSLIDLNFKYNNPVDSFVAKIYHPDPVYKCNFCHGEVCWRNHDGEDIIISGHIAVQYGNGHAYNIYLFNNHLVSDGFNIWRGDTGKVTIIAYASSDTMWNQLPTKAVRDIIDKDTIEKIFSKVEKDDEYGIYPKKLIECARGMMNEN